MQSGNSVPRRARRIPLVFCLYKLYAYIYTYAISNVIYELPPVGARGTVDGKRYQPLNLPHPPARDRGVLRTAVNGRHMARYRGSRHEINTRHLGDGLVGTHADTVPSPRRGGSVITNAESDETQSKGIEVRRRVRKSGRGGQIRTNH